jgi:DnaJ-class molecular chaperone
LARQNHRDLDAGDKTAETRFKDINTAYELLYDDLVRHLYERSMKRLEQSGLQPMEMYLTRTGRPLTDILENSANVQEVLEWDVANPEPVFNEFAIRARRQKRQNEQSAQRKASGTTEQANEQNRRQIKRHQQNNSTDVWH